MHSFCGCMSMLFLSAGLIIAGFIVIFTRGVPGLYTCQQRETLSQYTNYTCDNVYSIGIVNIVQCKYNKCYCYNSNTDDIKCFADEYPTYNGTNIGFVVLGVILILCGFGVGWLGSCFTGL